MDIKDRILYTNETIVKKHGTKFVYATYEISGKTNNWSRRMIFIADKDLRKDAINTAIYVLSFQAGESGRILLGCSETSIQAKLKTLQK